MNNSGWPSLARTQIKSPTFLISCAVVLLGLAIFVLFLNAESPRYRWRPTGKIEVSDTSNDGARLAGQVDEWGYLTARGPRSIVKEGDAFSYSARVVTEGDVQVFLRLGIDKVWYGSTVVEGNSATARQVAIRGHLHDGSLRPKLEIRASGKGRFSIEDISFQVGSHAELLEKARRHKIEYFNWGDLYLRQIYRSATNDIALTYGDLGIIEGGFYENFLVHDVDKRLDYFCIPDSFVLAYNKNSSFRTKLVALKWRIQHELRGDDSAVSLVHERDSSSGFNNAFINRKNDDGTNFDKTHVPLNGGEWQVPPLSMRLAHSMEYDKQYVPLAITIRNDHSEPLRVVYTFADAAFLSSGDRLSQDAIFSVWSDNESRQSRAKIVQCQQDSLNPAWFGYASPDHGGMFAGLLAFPSRYGATAYATSGDGETINMIGYPEIKTYDDVWRRMQEVKRDFSTSSFKGLVSVLDFGTLEPGESRTRVLYKIMFTGAADITTIRNRATSIAEQILKSQQVLEESHCVK